MVTFTFVSSDKKHWPVIVDFAETQASFGYQETYNSLPRGRYRTCLVSVDGLFEKELNTQAESY